MSFSFSVSELIETPQVTSRPSAFARAMIETESAQEIMAAW